MVGEVQDAKCAHFLDNRNLPENLTYMGHQCIEEVNRLFSGSDVFVNTSRPDGEGFPNTFIQAWLHAVPVLSFEMDPDSLLTVHGIGDCCKGSLECLFKALQHLLSNDEYRTTVGQRAREYSVTNFSTKNCATLLQLLESYAPKAN